MRLPVRKDADASDAAVPARAANIELFLGIVSRFIGRIPPLSPHRRVEVLRWC